MKLKEIINEIDVWDGWRDAYNKFVPQFIEEAKSKLSYTDWNLGIFKEFFERSNGQCVSSLQQGYFTNDEKDKIKKNWEELSPLLKQIAESQDIPLWEVYQQIQSTIKKYTKVNRKAATYRLIAGLQPQLLCTIVKEDSMRQLLSYLNKNVDSTENIPVYTGNWFKDSHSIFTFYKANSTVKDSYQLMTYPWQTIEYFEKDFDKNKERDMSDVSNELDLIKELLEYKKQIILQGPPGTGKTRLAKLIAEEMIFNNKVDLILKATKIKSKDDINISDIKLNLKIDDKIISSNGSTSYLIKEIDDKSCVVRGDGRDTNDTIVFSTLMKHIEKPEDYPLGTGLNSQYRAISNYILSKINDTSLSTIDNDEKLDPIASTNEYVKLIQFHPAYSYEDFVRGITAKGNGDSIEYKTENKLLASFAALALKNYEDSRKDAKSISEEQSIEKFFNDFIDSIQDEIDKKGKYFISESAYVFQVDDDAFKYTGDNWRSAFRIPFTEIMKMYKLNISERKEIKKHPAIIGRAKMHATYYFNLLEKFRAFIPDTIVIEDIITVTENNYVLVIDEINRANLPAVLGELIYALEYRGKKVESMYDIDGNNSLIIPPNLFIIGTMNTSDRSVGHIDYAIRRRFAFVDVLPDIEPIREAGIAKFKTVCELFIEDYDAVDWKDPKFKPSKHISSEFKPEDVMIGHSYFITKEKDDEGKLLDEIKEMELKLKYEIVPILKEYVKDGILKQSKEIETLINSL